MLVRMLSLTSLQLLFLCVSHAEDAGMGVDCMENPTSNREEYLKSFMQRENIMAPEYDKYALTIRQDDVPLLLSFIKNDPSHSGLLAINSILALSDLKSRDATLTLIDCVNGSNNLCYIVSALLEIGDPRAIPFLKKIMRSRKYHMGNRVLAAHSLIRFGGPADRQAAKEFLLDEDSRMEECEYWGKTHEYYESYDCRMVVKEEKEWDEALYELGEDGGYQRICERLEHSLIPYKIEQYIKLLGRIEKPSSMVTDTLFNVVESSPNNDFYSIFDQMLAAEVLAGYKYNVVEYKDKLLLCLEKLKNDYSYRSNYNSDEEIQNIKKKISENVGISVVFQGISGTDYEIR